MTLVERVRNLDFTLRAAVDEDQLRLKIGRLTDRARVVEDAADILERARIASEELRIVERKLPAGIRAVLVALHADLSNAREAISGAPLVGADDNFNKAVRKATDVATSASAALVDVWRSYRAGVEIPKVDEDFLHVLDRAGLDVAYLWATVENALARLSILAQLSLPRAGDVAALSQAVTSLQSAVEELGGLVPSGVRDFIVAASGTAGAPLHLLTDEVREFLTNTDLAARYRIRQGG
ncbi:hypothetical protein RMN56_06050 [Micromonospora halotolerans]|uniref:Uncharacterized protein n=1 Tax=Micromonospora halotolerans TaxID=709879 RepID=A0ABZ0A2R4_9ACTN|nr:hypothetical protein [Micromonospora halotolerans]WNM40911.1 hypothetical protein RMN56_06050 [Micromonospora halotolerans]